MRRRVSDLPFRNYSINQRMLFDENYGLASTQSLKNKDIPEGGAKGTILPSYVAFLLALSF
jgi:NAD-specific glutamate dehydrogenase